MRLSRRCKRDGPMFVLRSALGGSQSCPKGPKRGSSGCPWGSFGSLQGRWGAQTSVRHACIFVTDPFLLSCPPPVSPSHPQTSANRPPTPSFLLTIVLYFDGFSVLRGLRSPKQLFGYHPPTKAHSLTGYFGSRPSGARVKKVCWSFVGR